MEMTPQKKAVLSYSCFNLKDVSGGTAKYIVGQENTFITKNVLYLYFYPIKIATRKSRSNIITRYGLRINGKDTNRIFTPNSLVLNLKQLLKSFYVDSIHIHHLLFSKITDIIKICQCFTNIPIYYYLHDFFSNCHNYNLLLNNSSFCGNGKLTKEKCQNCKFYCISKREKVFKDKFFSTLFERLKIIAPSKSASSLFLDQFPQFQTKITIIPHLIIKTSNKTTNHYLINHPIRIGFLGRPVHLKGWDDFLNLSKMNNSNYAFYALGNGVYPKTIRSVFVSATKQNPDAMTKALIDNNIDIAFLWSIWPETFGYTFFESLKAKCYILTNSSSGNYVDNIIKFKCGSIFTNLSAVNSFLLDYDLVSKTLASYRQNCPNYIVSQNTEIINHTINRENVNCNIKLRKIRFTFIPSFLLLFYFKIKLLLTHKN